jgi:hypothetical protein
MPRPCSICRHPERLAIDQALAAKEPYRDIAERFETSSAALRRHQQTHAQPPGAENLTKPNIAAAIAAAHRVHASACLVQSQTRDLRSTHEPALLDRLEGLANVLVEMSRLLVALTTAPSRNAP